MLPIGSFGQEQHTLAHGSRILMKGIPTLASIDFGISSRISWQSANLSFSILTSCSGSAIILLHFTHFRYL
jgi:enoyl-[acyl-carrier-protein] reductase (NADH)